MPKTAGAGNIYQLKITLLGAKPPIWRRVAVPGAWALNKLHRVVQESFRWHDSHLHQFEVAGDYYGIPHPDDGDVGQGRTQGRAGDTVSEGEGQVHVLCMTLATVGSMRS